MPAPTISANMPLNHRISRCAFLSGVVALLIMGCNTSRPATSPTALTAESTAPAATPPTTTPAAPKIDLRYPQDGEPVYTRADGSCFVRRVAESHNPAVLRDSDIIRPPVAFKGVKEQIETIGDGVRSCYYDAVPTPESAGCGPGEDCHPASKRFWFRCTAPADAAVGEAPRPR